MSQVGWAFLVAAVLSLCAAAGLSCAGTPKRLTHSPQFVACRDMCMDNGAADALVLEKTEGLACVCVKQPERT